MAISKKRMEERQKNNRKTGYYESPGREAVDILNTEEDGNFEITYKFGDTYIQRDGINLLNVTHMSSLSADEIAERAKMKLK